MEQEILKLTNEMENIRADINMVASFAKKLEDKLIKLFKSIEDDFKSLEDDIVEKIKNAGNENGANTEYIKCLISDDFKEMSKKLILEIEDMLK